MLSFPGRIGLLAVVSLFLSGPAIEVAADDKLIDAAITRPWPGQEFPRVPAISTRMRSEVSAEIRNSIRIRAAFAKLDAATQRNVDWFEGVRLLEEHKAVWSLQVCLCHPHDDVRILALRALERLNDPVAVPFLLVYADYMAVSESGSENATLHGVIHESLAQTLSSLTGIQVTIRGQDPEALRSGIVRWQRWQVTVAGSSAAGRLPSDRVIETDAELLESLRADFEQLLKHDPHITEIRKAEQLLAETNSNSRWTSYKDALKIIRDTRSRSAIPLLLRYMYVHAEPGVGGVSSEYIDTINTLTGQKLPNPYRVQADRVTPMHVGVRKLTIEWWRPNRDSITTAIDQLSEEGLRVIVDKMLDEVRWNNDRTDVPANGQQSAYDLYHDLFYDVMQPGRLTVPPELHPVMVPLLLQRAGYRAEDSEPVQEPQRVLLELVPLLATLRTDGHVEVLDDIAADAEQYSATRLIAILALYAAGEELQDETIVSILDHERRLHHRLICILSFVRCRDSELAARVLLPLLSDRNAEIRMAAIYAIRQTRPPGGLAVLTKMLEEPRSRANLSSILDGIAAYESDEAKHTIAAFLEKSLAEGNSEDVYNTIGPFAEVTGERFYEAGAHSREYYVEQARKALAWWKQHLKDEQQARTEAERAAEERIRSLFVEQVTQFLEAKALREGKPVSRALSAVLESSLIVRRQPFTRSADRVSDTLTPAEQKRLILFGSVADLDRAGDCWAVEASSPFGISLAGYLDTESDRLVFLWIAPEG